MINNTEDNNVDDLVKKMDNVITRLDSQKKTENPYLDMILFVFIGLLIIVILDLFFRFGKKQAR